MCSPASYLLDFSPRTDHRAGLRTNVSVVIQYIGRGSPANGCLPVYHLIKTLLPRRSPVQSGNGSHPQGVLDDGRKITKALIRQLIPEELAKARALLGEAAWRAGEYEEAARLFDELTTGEYVEFLTSPGYEWLTRDLAQAQLV